MAARTTFRAETSWGDCLLTVDGDQLVGLRPPDGSRADEPDLRPIAEAPAQVAALADRLARYLDGEEIELAAADQVERWLVAAGVSGFRLELSRALLGVPRGVTISYGELAALAGRPGAARAAGTTCARNPLPILVPCHRVVHAGARRGDVGAYGAATGSGYKRRLLVLEHAALVR